MLFLGLVVLGSVAIWADQSVVRGQIQALFDRAGKGFDEKNVEKVMETAAPDAVLHFLDGNSFTIEQWKEQSKIDFANTKIMRSRFRVEEVQADGDAAVATYTESDYFVLRDNPGHRFQRVTRWRVTLRKCGQNWLAHHFVQLSDDLKCDGKPSAPPTAK